MMREQTYWLVKASMADTSKIHSSSDLWPLPWDKEMHNIDSPISEDESQELLNMMESMNKQNGV